MAVFDVPKMTAEQYDESMRRLDAAGQKHPPGRQFHAASARGNGWFVVDVWDSPETLNSFAKVLMPILVDIGVEPPTPQVLPVHRSVKP